MANAVTGDCPRAGKEGIDRPRRPIGLEPGLPLPFHVRAALPDDVPALLVMERQLAASEGHPSTVRATEEAWRRDGFGPAARFSSFVADRGGALVGMVTFNDFYLTAIAAAAVHIQDLFVQPEHRKHGIARALLARVAVEALKKPAPLVLLNVLENNKARGLYDRTGFQHIRQNLTYILAGSALAELAQSIGNLGALLS